MDVLLWIVFGLMVGVVAAVAMPAREPSGVLVTVVLGVAGALLGGWLGRVLGVYREGEAAGFLMSVVVAVIAVALHRLMTPHRPRS